MKVGTDAFAMVVLTMISTWGLNGCSKQEPATTATAATRTEEAEKGGEHADHADAKTAGHKRGEHVGHGHTHDGHTRGEHRRHEGGGHHDETAPHGGIKVGDKVPDFAVRTLDGKAVKLSELQKDERRTASGVVVLSFWCSTCHSCRDVEHLLAKLAKEYGGRAAVLALDANADETAEGVAAFLAKSGLALPVVLDPGGGTADLFGVRRTTTTVVIDGGGVLRYCGQFRRKDGGSAEEALQAVLAGKEVAIKMTPHNG
jgi:thiol-disulfide isomerase/thioredoxin